MPNDKSEDDYLFQHYKLRLKRFDRFAEHHTNRDVKKILDLCPKKMHEKSHDLDMLRFGKLIGSLDHYKLNALMYTSIDSGIVLPKLARLQIDKTLQMHLAKKTLTSADCDTWFYSANLIYQTLNNPSLYDSLIIQLSDYDKILLSNEQFFHLLFMLIVKRKHYDVLLKNSQRINLLLKKSNFIETATVSSAYFKTKSRIDDSNLIKKVIESTLRNRNQINFQEPGFCSIIKSIRYSRNYESRTDVQCMVDTLFKEVDSSAMLVSSFNKVHLLKLMEVYRIYDEKLLNQVTSMMFSNLEDYRIKDIQYILSSISNFAHPIENLKENLDKLVEQIVSEERNDTDMQYFHLMPILRSFAILNYYSDKLIAYINCKMENHPEVVTTMREAFEFDRSALLFYVASRLEGNKVHFSLNPSLLAEISSTIDRDMGNSGTIEPNSSLQHLQFLMNHKKTYLEISNRVREIGVALKESEELKHPRYSFYFQHTLPHQNYADLVITNAGKEVGAYDKNSYMPKFVPENLKYVSILAVQKFDYIDGEKRLSGYKQLNLRLLQKLGYQVVTVDLKNYNINSLATRIKSILEGNSQLE